MDKRFGPDSEHSTVSSPDNGAAGLTETRSPGPSPDSGAAPAPQPSDGGPGPSAAPIVFLNKNEPGGADDADTWLMVTVAMIPVGAIVGIIAHYVLADGGSAAPWSLLTGVIVATVMFVGLYVLYRILRFNTAQHASVVTYNDLCERMYRIASVELPSYEDPDLRAATQSAYRDVRKWAEAFDYARDKRGLHWVLGKGYVDLARTVHRAEEAMIMYEPIDMALADGWKDQSRLDGSTIPGVNDLLNQLRRALMRLSPESEVYLPQLPPTVERRDTSPDGASISAHLQARVVLSNVRFTVNDFRDSTVTKLIDARNELLARMFLTALATCLLLVFVVLARPPALTLLTGAILYAIGATVGLFSRLYADLGTDNFGEDYAISYVRLFQTFLLSGHAAIAGVYLAVALPVLVDNPTLRVETSTSATTITSSMPSLVNVFSIARYPFSIILAMIFGLTPGLLISRLSQGIEGYKQDLRSSELASKR